jgi:hypothetical protein
LVSGPREHHQFTLGATIGPSCLGTGTVDPSIRQGGIGVIVTPGVAFARSAAAGCGDRDIASRRRGLYEALFQRKTAAGSC